MNLSDIMDIEKAYEKALTVACPVCRAEPSESCVGTWHRQDVHASRALYFWASEDAAPEFVEPGFVERYRAAR